MADICGDNRFKIIERAKRAILDSTNIDTSPDEMKVLDNFLFRCWQMDWLDKYDENKRLVEQKQGQWIKDKDSNYYSNIYYCSNCLTYERVKTVMGKPAYNYCPNCGAKMVGGTEE